MKRYLNIPSSLCRLWSGEASLQSCDVFTCHDLQDALNSIKTIGDNIDCIYSLVDSTYRSLAIGDSSNSIQGYR